MNTCPYCNNQLIQNRCNSCQLSIFKDGFDLIYNNFIIRIFPQEIIIRNQNAPYDDPIIINGKHNVTLQTAKEYLMRIINNIALF